MENLVKDLLVKEQSRLVDLLKAENEKIKKEVSSLFNFDFNYSISNNSYDALNMTFDILDESGKRLFGHSVDISQRAYFRKEDRKVYLNHGTMGSFNSEDTTRIDLLLMTYAVANNLNNIEKIYKNHEEKLDSILADIEVVEDALDRIKDEELTQKKEAMKKYVDEIISANESNIELIQPKEVEGEYDIQKPRVYMSLRDSKSKTHLVYKLKFLKKDKLGNWKVEGTRVNSYNWVESFTCSYSELYDAFKKNEEHFLSKQ